MTKSVEGFPMPRLTDKNHRTLAGSADVHVCYEAAVQNVRQEVENIYNFYMELRPLVTSRSEPSDDEFFDLRIPLVLREDFCGTAILCKEWLKKNVMRSAMGIDLDHCVLDYAKTTTFNGDLPNNMKLIADDVMNVRPDEEITRADILVALNYSIGYFHTFRELVGYTRRAREGLASGGVFICDMFSNGTTKPDKSGQYSFVRDCGTFTYHFTQTVIDPLDNTSDCHLGFEFPDGSWLRNVFTYHFRIWSIAEIRDVLLEAGFSAVEFWGSHTSATGSKKRLVKMNSLEKLKRSTFCEHPLNFYAVAI